jgi:tellurite resistance protein
MSSLALDLPSTEPDRLRAAVRSAFGTLAPSSEGLPTRDRLRAGAEQVQKDETSESEAARYFQALLEVGYLVASADGFADEERQALAELLEDATGRAVDQSVLKLHFQDLDQAVQMLGRHERLRRAAADFEDIGSREEALGFATLVAVADGIFAEPEAQALLELGGFMELSEQQIRGVVDRVVARIKKALAS